MADFEVNRRLKYLITEVFKMTPHKFSLKFNDTGGVKTSQVLRERNGLSNKLLENIIQAYPEINKTWLLTGEGEMLLKNNSKEQINEVKEPGMVYGGPPKTLMESQAMLISIQEQLVRNNTKLVDTNNKLAEQVIELCSQQSSPGTKELIESIRKEVIESVKSELKNFHAREDAGCANVG